MGDANDALCNFLSFGGIDILLDCGINIGKELARQPILSHSSVGNQTTTIELPALNAIDVASLDVVLISYPQSMLALPFLTEYLGFKVCDDRPCATIQV